jgi:hypothetical protein
LAWYKKPIEVKDCVEMFSPEDLLSAVSAIDQVIEAIIG